MTTRKPDVCLPCSMPNQTEQTKRRNKRRTQKKPTSGNGAVLSSAPDTENYVNSSHTLGKLLHDGNSKETQQQIQKQPLHLSMEQLHMNSVKNQINTNFNAKPNASRRAAGANWKILHNSEVCANVLPNNNAHVKIRQNSDARDEQPSYEHNTNAENGSPSKSARLRQKRKRAIARNRYVAIDCEMVGIGENGQDDMLARVSVVNKDGKVLLDKFVKPRETVVNYRTSVSGIRPHDIENGEEFDKVQNEVVDLLQGKILIGHAINNDLAVLHISHPYTQMRDTSSYRPLCRLVSNGHTPSLKKLAKVILGIDIQNGEHSSVEDARAAMSIYNKLSNEWEKHHKLHCRPRSAKH